MSDAQRSRLALWLLAVFLSGGVTLAEAGAPGGGCRLVKGRFQGYEEYVLENDLIRVSLLPPASGKILNYVFKPTGEACLQPLEEETIEFADPPIVMKTNYAGYKDMIWEHGFSAPARIYQAEVVSATRDRVAVALVWRGRDLELRRTAAIRRGSTEVQIVTEIMSTAAEAQRLSYWCQTPVRVADPYGPKGTQMVPVRPVPSTDKVRGRAWFDGAAPQVVVQTVPPRSTNYPPAQPWWGLRNPGTGLILGQVCAALDALLPDGFFYTFCGETLVTQEVIFATRDYEPNGTRAYTVSFVVVNGLERLAYLSRNLAIGAPQAPRGLRVGDELEVEFPLASPRRIPRARLQLVLHDGRNGVLPIGSAVTASLVPISARHVALRGALAVPPGLYVLGIRLLEDGAAVETAALLGHQLRVTP